MTGDQPTAEDVAQDAFLGLFPPAAQSPDLYSAAF
jgi:DNA-directed RNA polymerase specialized sigma24 family protein